MEAQDETVLTDQEVALVFGQLGNKFSDMERHDVSACCYALAATILAGPEMMERMVDAMRTVYQDIDHLIERGEL